MGRKTESFSHQDIAKCIITSKETAEVFIKSWMERHNATREMAIARLKELGIELSQLRDKN